MEISDCTGATTIPLPRSLLGQDSRRAVREETPGVKVEIVESGVFHGFEGARRVFVDMLGKLYNYEGNCAIHELTTPVIQIQRT